MIINGDCIEEMRKLEDNSVDSIVTDPPYELGFMSKKWDGTGIAYNVDVWKEALRVLKPGGHMLAFSGTRTYHRMVCAIEDAGFEIRDMMQWIYGSGMPHGQDVSKAIDKLEGAKRPLSEVQRPIGGKNGVYSGNGNKWQETTKEPQTENAIKWSGWNTLLKPANEPIVVARKPISEKTVADNVLKWGTGGINIDDSRIEHNEPLKTTTRHGRSNASVMTDSSCGFDNTKDYIASANPSGRFPANVLLDEVSAELLDKQSGHLKSGTNCTRTKTGSFLEHGGLGKAGDIQITYGDNGGASRFFYCAKASKSERGKYNDHVTVKPIKLMSYLVKLITPPNGIVLDMFCGSGTTGIAALNNGFDFIGIEKESHYFDIANQRITENHDKK